MAEVVEITKDAEGADIRQCLYAAAFLCPGIEDVAYDKSVWTFRLERPFDRTLLSERLGRLVERFATPPIEPKVVFRLAPPASSAMPGLPDVLTSAQKIAPGLFIYDAAFSRIVRFLDDAIVRRFVPAFRAREEAYPNVIPVESLAKANHLSSFPEHLHFVSHLESDVETLDAFAARARDPSLASVSMEDTKLGPIRFVHNPSTCYHCYACREGVDIAEDTAVTAITKCHRYEGLNHKDPGRLMEFSLREVIFLGSPDYVRKTRQRSLELVEDMVKEWNIFGELITANDPFFSSDFANKASHQHRLALKYEYKADLPPARPISILSSNLHGPTFSKAFSISQKGRPINTGCIGFGLERMVLAIFAQYGVMPQSWPDALAGEYHAWCATDPLGA